MELAIDGFEGAVGPEQTAGVVEAVSGYAPGGRAFRKAAGDQMDLALPGQFGTPAGRGPV
jgi:hypothetical protein